MFLPVLHTNSVCSYGISILKGCSLHTIFAGFVSVLLMGTIILQCNAHGKWRLCSQKYCVHEFKKKQQPNSCFQNYSLFTI